MLKGELVFPGVNIVSELAIKMGTEIGLRSMVLRRYYAVGRLIKTFTHKAVAASHFVMFSAHYM